MSTDSEIRLIRAIRLLKEPQGSTLPAIIEVVNKEKPHLSLKSIVKSVRECLINGIITEKKGKIKLAYKNSFEPTGTEGLPEKSGTAPNKVMPASSEKIKQGCDPATKDPNKPCPNKPVCSPKEKQQAKCKPSKQKIQRKKSKSKKQSKCQPKKKQQHKPKKGSNKNNKCAKKKKKKQQSVQCSGNKNRKVYLAAEEGTRRLPDGLSPPPPPPLLPAILAPECTSDSKLMEVTANELFSLI
ncbi:UNVERIFIED_CONTAM: hypothetical protein PYX00_007617 [Menopon gallinae]|uniref:H15 domain-containing protein n=1 Tax=Menopon gallinae TaxID=328185 RepID=A0AAW2HK08_9NEOP